MSGGLIISEYLSRNLQYMEKLNQTVEDSSSKDKQWVREYLIKYVQLKDLHTYIDNSIPKSNDIRINLGIGNLNSKLVIVLPHILNVNEQAFYTKLLSSHNLNSYDIYTTMVNKCSVNDAKYDSEHSEFFIKVLRSELAILKPALVLFLFSEPRIYSIVPHVITTIGNTAIMSTFSLTDINNNKNVKCRKLSYYIIDTNLTQLLLIK